MAGLGVGGIGGMPGMRGDNANVDPEAMLNTCIHNYFISKEKPHIAKAIRDGGLNIEHGKLKMENKTQMNGADAGDADSKDDKSRLGSLDASDNFLLDYWFIFWDMWKASKEKADPNTAASQYLQMTQNQRQMRPNNLVQPGAMNNFGQMRANPNTFNLQRQAQLNTINGQNPRRGPMTQQPMQRDGSGGEMNGDQRPGSPMSGGESAPSPKRQRLDGNFNGQQMGMGGRNSLGSQLPNGAGGNMEAMLMQQGINPRAPMDAQSRSRYQMALAQNQMAAQQAILTNAGQNGMNLPAGSFNAGASPLLAADGAPIDMSMMGNGQMRNSNGNQGGALADYQMQLMLLEQQNKKRLMMARQEQEHPPFPGNSPHGRNGSPMPDGTIRNSPAPPFNPGPGDMNGQFPSQMRVGDAAMGGNPMMRNPGTHQLNGQNMEILRRQNMQMPNGQWQGAPMQGQMAQGQGGLQQQNENGQQQRGTMPPPQVPAAGNKQQPSPPTQNAAPPTPSQKKDNKAKKDGKGEKKKAAKNKAANASATPNLENDRPPTPVPQTPVTPVNPDAQVIKGQNNHQPQAQQQQQQGNQNQQNQGNQQQPQQLNNGQMPSNQETAPNEQPFGAVENYADSFDFGAFMHNAGDGGEEQHGVDGIISDFDFENFLNVEQGTNWDNAPFNFDTSLGTES